MRICYFSVLAKNNATGKEDLVQPTTPVTGTGHATALTQGCVIPDRGKENNARLAFFSVSNRNMPSYFLGMGFLMAFHEQPASAASNLPFFVFPFSVPSNMSN